MEILESKITYDEELIYARGFMVDTNVYNYSSLMSTRDSGLCIALYATHVQLDEILNMGKTKRRGSLLRIFTKNTNFIIPTVGCVLDISSLDACLLDDDTQWFEEALAMLRKFDGRSKLMNQVRDVLILRTCQKTNKILVTQDKNLKALAEKYGVKVRMLQPKPT